MFNFFGKNNNDKDDDIPVISNLNVGSNKNSRDEFDEPKSSLEESVSASDLTKSKAGSNNVINFQTVAVNHSANTPGSGVGKQHMKVMVVEPVTFDDAQHVADHIRNRKPVVLNFENTETEVARRIIDFISGTTYALAGELKNVAKDVFICTPSNVDVKLPDKENLDSEKDNNGSDMPTWKK